MKKTQKELRKIAESFDDTNNHTHTIAILLVMRSEGDFKNFYVKQGLETLEAINTRHKRDKSISKNDQFLRLAVNFTAKDRFSDPLANKVIDLTDLPDWIKTYIN